MAVDARPNRAAGRGPAPRRRPTRRRKYFHGGAFSMLLIATLLAVITSFAATVIYADIDAGHPLVSPTTTLDPSAVTSLPPPTLPPSTTTIPPALTIDDLNKKVAGSIKAVHTFDQSGQPVNGTALVIGTLNGQTLLLTSYSLVQAATLSPAPPLTVGDNNQPATLWTWQENRDLALLVISGSVVALPWAPAPPKVGDKVYVAGAGVKLSVGIVTSITPNGIAHNVFMDDVRQGAPLVNEKGEVLGLASKVYDPDGRGTDTVFVAVPIRLSCERVLQCGSGNTAPGQTTTVPTTITPTTKPAATTSTVATSTTKPVTTTTTIKR